MKTLYQRLEDEMDSRNIFIDDLHKFMCTFIEYNGLTQDFLDALKEEFTSLEKVKKNMDAYAAEYDNEDCNQFVRDMEDIGMITRNYHGRNFYEGPAISCDNIQDVLSKTEVPCQWDQLGKGFIVYPKSCGKMIREADDEGGEN